MAANPGRPPTPGGQTDLHDSNEQFVGRADLYYRRRDSFWSMTGAITASASLRTTAGRTCSSRRLSPVAIHRRGQSIVSQTSLAQTRVLIQTRGIGGAELSEAPEGQHRHVVHELRGSASPGEDVDQLLNVGRAARVRTAAAPLSSPYPDEDRSARPRRPPECHHLELLVPTANLLSGKMRWAPLRRVSVSCPVVPRGCAVYPCPASM